MTKKRAARPKIPVRRSNRTKTQPTATMSETERDTIEAISLAREVLGARVPSSPPSAKRRQH
jgi:hypothetical protein